ncbi:MAG: GNAT family N-acetyltransferase [Chloroflexi bacterium]|nr:GNAT family N-acetyltransferase [Chloroflexota bacterium]
MTIAIHPLTPERWSDFEAVLGPRGGPGGCWCMYWRLPHKEFEAGKGQENRGKLKARVESDLPAPGLLAYVDGRPAGWCALAPRGEYPRLATSRVLKPVDEQPVWSVVCFFIHKDFRKQGLAAALLEAAAEYARQHGATILEGYPIVPRQDEVPSVFAWTGFASTFEKCGFGEAARRSETRPVMRRKLGR